MELPTATESSTSACQPDHGQRFFPHPFQYPIQMLLAEAGRPNRCPGLPQPCCLCHEVHHPSAVFETRLFCPPLRCGHPLLPGGIPPHPSQSSLPLPLHCAALAIDGCLSRHSSASLQKGRIFSLVHSDATQQHVAKCCLPLAAGSWGSIDPGLSKYKQVGSCFRLHLSRRWICTAKFQL